VRGTFREEKVGLEYGPNLKQERVWVRRGEQGIRHARIWGSHMDCRVGTNEDYVIPEGGRVWKGGRELVTVVAGGM